MYNSELQTIHCIDEGMYYYVYFEDEKDPERKYTWSTTRIDDINNSTEQHISPNSQLIMLFRDDKMYISRFKKIVNGGVKVLGVHPATKPVEIETSDMTHTEIAERVKFESSDVIRFLTRDNRDILYKLESDLVRVKYLGETSLLKLDTCQNKFKTIETESAFQYIVQRNNQFRSHYWH